MWQSFISGCLLTRLGFISVGGWNFRRLSRQLLQKGSEATEARLRQFLDPTIEIKETLHIKFQFILSDLIIK
jgi:hypothetical protein